MGQARSAGFSTVLGYPAEIVPLDSPYAIALGTPLRVRCLVGGRPVGNQAVLWGVEKDGQAFPQRSTRTDADGVAIVTPDRAGDGTSSSSGWSALGSRDSTINRSGQRSRSRLGDAQGVEVNCRSCAEHGCVSSERAEPAAAPATGTHGHDQHHAHHAHMVDDFRRRFWISLALTIPVLATSEMVQHFLGLRATLAFPGDRYVEFAFASAVYFTAVGRFSPVSWTSSEGGCRA